MTIVGYRKYCFNADNGKTYSGYKVYCTVPGYGDMVGDTVDSFSVSDMVCHNSDFVPALGMDVEISYRKESKSVARVFIL